MIAVFVQKSQLQMMRRVRNRLQIVQSLDFVQKLLDLVVFQLLPRDWRRVRPRSQNLGVSLVEALEITAGKGRDLKPVSMGPVVFKRVAGAAQCR